MVKVVLCTDSAVFFAAFHLAKAEEKEVDPLEVCVCVCACVSARMYLCVSTVCLRHARYVSCGLLNDMPCICEHMEA